MKPLNLVGHQRPIQKVLFNRTGDVLFSCCQGGELCAWDPNDGRLLRRYAFFVGGQTVQRTISSLDLSYTGMHLLAASAEGVFMFDVVTGTQLLHLPLGMAVCRFVDLNKQPNNQYRIAVARDHFSPNPCAILVYDFPFPLKEALTEPLKQSPKLMLEITDFQKKAVGVSWGIFDETLISWHDDGKLCLWDASTGAKKMEVVMFSERITCLDFTKDRTLCLCTSSDHNGKLLSTLDFSVVQTYSTDRPLNACSISPLLDKPERIRKMHILVGGGQSKDVVTTTKAQEGKQEAMILNAVNGAILGLIGGHFSPINSIAFMVDGSGFATGAEEGNCRIYKFDPKYYQLI